METNIYKRPTTLFNRRLTDIPDHFTAIYRELFSSVSDPIYTISSDCFKHAPEDLFIHLAKFIRCFIYHGHVSKFLLISSLILLVMDKFSSRTLSKTYRLIAISSLICKLVDIIIIDLYGDVFRTDKLQFGFQSESSTSMCTWFDIETIGYYNRNITNVYGSLMDLSKAFDKVHHSKLFTKLLGKVLSPFIYRLLMSMYRNQEFNVKWNGKTSNHFKIYNGVKHSAILSHRLFSIYMDSLF